MRAVWVVALLVPLTGAADGMEPPAAPVEGTEYRALGGKSVDQVHSPILVFNQPFRFKAPAQARNEDSNTMDDGSRSTNPCSRDGYHDNVMSHGLDTARTKCERHQFDKNRWQLLALSGGDLLLHNAMEKQLDKGLDLFGVPK